MVIAVAFLPSLTGKYGGRGVYPPSLCRKEFRNDMKRREIESVSH
jgi:hypothetical protein